MQALRAIESLRTRQKLFLVNENTFTLIRKAKLVVTINSTVGLEAMLMGKEVVTLASSYYRDVKPDQLGSFVLSYLIDMDYFSDGEISAEQAKCLLSRFEKPIISDGCGGRSILPASKP